MRFTIPQIYQIAIDAGFPPDTAVKMAAVAMKESAGDPAAFNGRRPDLSYGLWQINMIGALGPARRAEYGLNRNEDLFDPATNARVAYDLWAGNDGNIARHWGTEVEPFATSYRQWLARAELELTGGGQVMQAYNGGSDLPSAGTALSEAVLGPLRSALPGVPDEVLLVGAGVAAAVVLAVLLG